MTLENKNVVIRFNKEFLEEGNKKVLDELIAPDFVNRTAPAVIPDNVDGLIQFVDILHRGFPDLKVEILDQVAEGDIVASRKSVSGTHLGEIMGKKPTGKKVTFKVMDFVRIKNGQYLEHWGQNNIMQVIGEL